MPAVADSNFVSVNFIGTCHFEEEGVISPHEFKGTGCIG